MSFMKPLLAGAALGAAVLASSATSAGAAASTVKFKVLPQHLFQGGPAVVSVVVTPRNRQCGLAVRYADGANQPGLVAQSAAGLREWRWTVGNSAAAGPARATVSCGRSGVLTRTITVVGGTLRHSKLTITAQGFSQRPASYGTGSSVSYGVVLHNPSPAADAQNVTVLVNFLDGSDHVLDSATTNVPAIAAASTFNLGGSDDAREAERRWRASRSSSRRARTSRPHFTSRPSTTSRSSPARSTPTGSGRSPASSLNDHPTDLLTNAQLSIVLFDAAGHVVGGSTGSMSSSLPPGRARVLQGVERPLGDSDGECVRRRDLGRAVVQATGRLSRAMAVRRLLPAAAALLALALAAGAGAQTRPTITRGDRPSARSARAARHGHRTRPAERHPLRPARPLLGRDAAGGDPDADVASRPHRLERSGSRTTRRSARRAPSCRATGGTCCRRSRSAPRPSRT